MAAKLAKDSVQKSKLGYKRSAKVTFLFVYFSKIMFSKIYQHFWGSFICLLLLCRRSKVSCCWNWHQRSLCAVGVTMQILQNQPNLQQNEWYFWINCMCQIIQGTCEMWPVSKINTNWRFNPSKGCIRNLPSDFIFTPFIGGPKYMSKIDWFWLPLDIQGKQCMFRILCLPW